ncbi:MAG: sigma-70 family RNA polymerase sigma factor [Armatimonadetes bacterium]|nr:sigma-70 family RNA polymerase sigma factor [Armatimonadota bacterium]
MSEDRLPSDAELVSAILDAHGDEDGAWRALVERCRPLLVAVLRGFAARHVGGTLWEVGDLYQELYMHLSEGDWRRLRSYREMTGARFGSWLAAVAYDLVSQRHRRRHPVTVSLDEGAHASAAALGDCLLGDQGRLDEWLVAREEAQALQDAIARLTHRECREIIRRHYYRDEEFVEIARTVGLKAATVRQMHHRNKRELAELLRQRGFGS